MWKNITMLYVGSVYINVVKGRRNTGRPRKRWRDQLHLEDQGKGSTPNPSGT